MKIIYWLLIILLLYIGFFYVRFRIILSQANLAHIEQSERTIGTGPILRYLAAGDSTAVGEGATSAEKSYPYLVTDYLATKQQVMYKNIAAVGATTSDLVNSQLQQIVDYSPDIVTISIGANDITHVTATSEIIKNYQNIITTLTQKTHATIYITNVARLDQAYLLPYPLRWYFDNQSKAANTKLADLGTDRVKFIDIHSVAVSNSTDQFHPSDKGYTFWANAFLEQIK